MFQIISVLIRPRSAHLERYVGLAREDPASRATMPCVSVAPIAPMPPTVRMPPAEMQQHAARSTRTADEIKRNPYRVIRQLGKGLQGRVLLVHDEYENRYVAIKTPAAFHSNAPGKTDWKMMEYQMQSILAERRVHAMVRHENVLQYIRMIPGKWGNISYDSMVVEYASNGDLFDLISQTGPLSEDAAKFYFLQLVRGLRACHRSGVVHRDIKPENILFDAQFTLKICDFGLAVAVPDGTRLADLMLCGVGGTALYMAPEVNTSYPYRAVPLDVWCCGVLLFIMLTSYPPFEAAKPSDYWFNCVLKNRMDMFWAAQPEEMALPSAAAMDLINRLLCADPNKRITLEQALAHPWLDDVDVLDRESVMAEMRVRRRQVVAASAFAKRA